MNNKNWKKRQNSYKFPPIPVRISEIPGNSRREFLGSRFPGIPERDVRVWLGREVLGTAYIIIFV